MFGKAGIEQIVEKVVSKVLDRHMDGLREELVNSVLEEVKPQLGKSAEATSGGAAALLQTVTAIQGVTSQRDVLRALVDGAAAYCGRAALFILKGGAATGWHGHALPESIKDFVLGTNSGAVAQVLNSRRPYVGSTEEMDQDFISEFGGPSDGKCILAPLRLKDKAAALVYADAGVDKKTARLDAAAIELLVLVTGTWLEVASGRKPAGREPGHEADAPVAKAAAAHAGSSFSDPFAAHAPAFSHPATPASEETAPSLPGASELSPEDADVHRKAQRFARLLVDEIKLYNQAKLMEGRKNKDLYDRLKEDIDKSRSTYQKRYGATVAGPADYFSQELIRSLAEDDASLLGNNFPR
jgi:hypothetical protein